MPIAGRSLVFVLLLVPMPLAAAAQSAEKPAEKPVLRSTMPAHVDAPRTPASGPHAPRAVQRAAAEVKDKDKVNINNADVKQLMALSGVSRKIAERIVAYRDTHGPFKKPNELRKVDGVDDGVLDKNRGRIVVR